jgi:hypothetical protein
MPIQKIKGMIAMSYTTVRYFYLISLMSGLFWLSAPACFAEQKSTFIQTRVAPGVPIFAGQKISFSITLYSTTRFTGVPRFELPEISHLILMEIEDRPLLGSTRKNNTEFLTKTHEFAAFVQREGRFSIPSFTVSFACIDIRTNAAIERVFKTDAIPIDVIRPPGTTARDAILSTRKFELRSSWDPPPKTPGVGDAFKRIITRTAADIPGMVFLPVQPEIIPGISMYTAPPSVQDRMERGDFIGKRIDTITYVCEQAGRYEIPGLTFYWFDLETKKLRKEQLDPVVLTVIPAVQHTNAPLPDSGRSSFFSPISRPAVWAIAIVLICMGLFRAKTPIVRRYALRKQRNARSEKTFFARFESACRSGNDEKILQTLFNWLDRLEPDRQVLSIRGCFTAFHDPQLLAVFTAIERRAYGAFDPEKITQFPSAASTLRDLVRQYRRHRLKNRKNQQVTARRLDPLNP